MIDVDYNEYKETLEDNMRLIPENHKLKEEIERLNKQVNDALIVCNDRQKEIQRLDNTIRKINKILDNQIDYKEDRDIVVAIEEVIKSE